MTNPPYSRRNSSTTMPVASKPAADRRNAIREQARQEIPELRRQAEQGIATLQRLAKRAAS